MKLPWRRDDRGQPHSVAYGPEGIRLAVPIPDASPGAMTPAHRYLAQLAEEQLAVVTPSGYLVAWDSLYQVIDDPDHQGGLKTLCLPAMGDWIPVVVSSGTPSDPDFSIWIDGWSSTSEGRWPVNVTGGLAKLDQQRWLLGRDQWLLCQAIDSLQNDVSGLTTSQRLHAIARIQQLSKSCGALLDDYLSRTPVIAPETLSIELMRCEALGETVVEISPGFEGAPKSFVDAFDRYGKVQNRYDLPTEDGGLTHVVPGERALGALSAIKAIPARRVASDRARLFIHNPYTVLGDDAREAIDEEQFLRARSDAGLIPYRLEAEFPADGSAVAHFIPGDSTQRPELLPLDQQLASSLIAEASRSRSRSLPLFATSGREVELTPGTDRALREIAAWLSGQNIDRIAQGFSEFLRLDDYSDRVVGFDEAKPQLVPYVAKRSAEKGWLPENTERGVMVPGAVAGAVERIAIDDEALAQLRKRVEVARQANESAVRLPGREDVTLPLEQADKLLGQFQTEDLRLGRDRSPRQIEKPKPSGRKATLRILHNLESLDYGAPIALSSPSPSDKPGMPAALRSNVNLLPHQLYGVAWMQSRFSQREQGIEGCLLADDMGLGKTLQSLALMAWYDETHRPARPCLVVAPVSLLQNWRAEVTKFLQWSDDDVLSLYADGVAQCRAHPGEIPTALSEIGVRKLLRPGFELGRKLVLTTYETLRDFELSIAKVHWGVVVCDEAQKIKNPAAFVTQAAKALRADFKIACTGTPVENSLADLWCLFDFIQPGSLGSLAEFTRVYRQEIESRGEGHAVLIEKLRAGIEPWVLRRLKSEVATDLPRKVDADHPDADPANQRLRMSSQQARLYDSAVAEFRRARKSADKRERSQILALLAKLRMICAHPAMELHSDHEMLPVKTHLDLSPKLAWLMERLMRIRDLNEKAIVFSEFRDVQRLLQRSVAEVLGVTATIINGSTSVDSDYDHSRQRIIDRFQKQDGFGVLILSTTAVGFGVNIQAANHVIHFTRPWNPAKEDQATDRAYRIGQTKDVYVYCPTVVGDGFESFEQRLDELLRSKRSLSRDMLAGVQEVTAGEFDGI
jgi:hypothetical protein